MIHDLANILLGLAFGYVVGATIFRGYRAP